MHISISGSSGFIGSYLTSQFEKQGHTIHPIKRTDNEKEIDEKMSRSEVIINLAGSPILQCWNEKNKKTIVDSRVLTTRKIVASLNKLPNDSSTKLFISASATGIYDTNPEHIHTEESKQFDNGFLGEVVKKWEIEALKLSHPSVRIVIARIGVVLGEKGGMLKKVIPLFKLGLGGNLGAGNQIISFIHIDDLYRSIVWFIDHAPSAGTYNLVSPYPVTNKEFTSGLAKKLKRWAFIPVPSTALYMLFGKAADIMLKGTKIFPKNLLAENFTFNYPTLASIFKQL
jgi:uncharacterized protein